MYDFLSAFSTLSFGVFIFIVYATIFLTPFEEETKIFSGTYWLDIIIKNFGLFISISILIGCCKFVDYAAHYLAKQ